MKRIPIAAAKRIAQEYNCTHVVIFGYDDKLATPKERNNWWASYGTTISYCKQANIMLNKMIKIIFPPSS